MRKKVINIHSLVEKIEIKTCCSSSCNCSGERRAGSQNELREAVVYALLRVINDTPKIKTVQ